ncbi:alkaline phosphatase family protein [Aliiglaciecola sp. LCG003]|uniref:alkaline phosphatase family protein n=1 Tax=Aliiglaciecola sp. LCG003 TaxID=3053655 RepID=UPI0025744930|nr:alkaline phosphatase family protein [Aliiglaciecola sp. LCG003]WJG09607.1 alkaline phosphatase family protein [Aliiglaciecola sp. LCG003]
MRTFMLMFILLASFSAVAKSNLIVITIDGLRWQEVFRGADENLIKHADFVQHPEVLKQVFWDPEPAVRRAKLMPFFWETLVKQGIAIGNRDIGSNMSAANPWLFSYPGYSEIFTGRVDESLNSNQKIPNPNISFLEYLNNQPGYGSNIAVFAGWDVFPAIFNTQRSKLYVNAGFMPAPAPLTENTKLLNALQQEIPSPWHNVRLDAFTYRFAKEYLLTEQPSVLAIAFAETDDFAHDGSYDQYLKAANRTDAFIQDLWETLQSMPKYRNNTTLLITTDHGRGSDAKQWQHHASRSAIEGYMKNLAEFPDGIVGSEHIWLAAIGPQISAKGQVTTLVEIEQQQIAATALTLLGEDPVSFNPKAANMIKQVIEK